MKRMRQLLGILALTSMLSAGLSGCGKYEEGPWMSFRSRTERVANKWKIEKWTEKGVDQTAQALLLGLTWEFTDDGKATMTVSFMGKTESKTGTWAFANDDLEIDITMGGDKDSFTILKLKESEFWIKSKDDKDESEIHFIPA